MAYRGLSALVCGVCLLGAVQPASALDGEDLARKLSAAIATTGMRLDVGAVSTQADAVTLHDARISLSAASGVDVAFSLGAVLLTEVYGNADGGYTALHVELAAFASENGPHRVAVAPISIATLTMAGGAAARPGQALSYDLLEAGALSYSRDGQILFAADGLGALLGFDGDRSFFEQSWRRVRIDHAALLGTDIAALLPRLDIETVEADISLSGEWNAAEGSFEISALRAELPGLGAIGARLELGGFTGLPVDPEQVAIKSAMVYAEDHGIVASVLETAGQAQGVMTMVSKTLAALQPETLRTEVADALEGFLMDGGAIRFGIDPQPPIAFAEIMVLADREPASLPARLNLSAAAND